MEQELGTRVDSGTGNPGLENLYPETFRPSQGASDKPDLPITEPTFRMHGTIPRAIPIRL
jgi:hypothetical protein